jgi:hypothetical protein
VFCLSSNLVNCLVRLRILLQQLRISLVLSAFSPERHRQHCPPASSPPTGCPIIPACPTISSPLVALDDLRDLVAAHIQSLINAEQDLPQYHATVANLTHQFERHLTVLVATVELTQPCNKPFCTSFENSSPLQLLPPFTPHFRCPGFRLTP